tara:strand:- start:68 stop:391 length:324 start_codon:yes stop_codon:yes gene_type:complete
LADYLKNSLYPFILLFVIVSSVHADSDVKCIQEFLKKTAFDPGLVDGKWGKGTGVAINSLFDQVGLNKKGQEVTVEQANEICAVLKSDKYKEILELGQFKIFSIDIK